MTRIAINGFGRIGRATLRALSERNSEIDVVAINDLGDVEELARLLKFDTTLGRFPGTVEATGDSIVVNG
ncbi:type I glyceraldehyde-3-phosphate dehydrogenase, partial [Mycobacterium tuberculosis]|nr:type I glyceraldehyde-3-phosphate dehydrogenase [Mycobacterium tuberculosis]